MIKTQEPGPASGSYVVAVKADGQPQVLIGGAAVGAEGQPQVLSRIGAGAWGSSVF